eukprot:6904803-Alexandrium_andersonii.AAC.1
MPRTICRAEFDVVFGHIAEHWVGYAAAIGIARTGATVSGGRLRNPVSIVTPRTSLGTPTA